MAEVSPLHFSSQKELRDVKALLLKLVKQRLDEAAKSNLSKQRIKILTKQLANMAKSIMSKASQNVPVQSEAVEHAELDLNLQEQCEAAMKLAADYKRRLAVQQAELESCITATIQQQFVDAETALIDGPTQDDSASSQAGWPGSEELSRLTLVREEVAQALSRLEQLLPSRLDAADNLAAYLQSDAKPRSEVEHAVQQAQQDQAVRGERKSPRKRTGKAASSRLAAQQQRRHTPY